MSEARAIGILVVYSEAYLARALAEFRMLMERIGLPHVLVVVSNNPALDLAGATDYVVLQGDNAMHEFSAWQTGLDHCRAQGLDRDAVLHVFANDTFCHHRVFGGFQLWAFTRAFRHLAGRRGPGFAGETFALEAPVRLDGQVFPAWVSTYLFAFNRAGLAALGHRIAAPRAEIDLYVNGGTDEAAFFTDRLPENLRLHLRGWLFEPETRPRWHRSAALGPANTAMMSAKARAIVSEMLLAARATAGGVKTYGVYRSLAVRVVRRLRGMLGLGGGRKRA